MGDESEKGQIGAGSGNMDVRKLTLIVVFFAQASENYETSRSGRLGRKQEIVTFASCCNARFVKREGWQVDEDATFMEMR